MKLLPQAFSVEFERIVEAIEQFNRMGLNPYGPNVPVRSHSPLLLKFEGPGIAVEFEFYPADRTPATLAFLKANPTIRTRHPVLYPMTRALIQRQWHRVYAYDVTQGRVTDVKLLVSKKQDPGLFEQHPRASAYPWVFALKDAPEPVALD